MKYKNVIDARRDDRRRHIWLCADDYGISPAVNVAIRDLVVRGRINATSVMVVAPNFYRSEAISLNVLNASETRVAIGLHVTLTAPYQPLSRKFQPVYDGTFLSKRATARHSFLHLLQREMLAHRHKVAPLPLAEARQLRRELLAKAQRRTSE